MGTQKLQSTIMLIVIVLTLAGFWLIFQKLVVGKKSKLVTSADEEFTESLYYGNFFDRDNKGYDVSDEVVTSRRITDSSLYVEKIITEPVEAVVIGGSQYKIGDSVEGYKIIDIREEVVIVSDGKDVYELKLGQGLNYLNK
jgi:hypothetical protein